MGFADSFPLAVPQDLTACRTRSIFYHWYGEAARDIRDGGDITRHAHLMYTEDGLGALRNRGLYFVWIDIECAFLDVDKNWHCAAVANAIRGGNERMTDRDHLGAGVHADREQGKMKSGGAIRHGAGVACPYMTRKLALERGYFGTLRDPARENRPRCSLGLAVIEPWLGERYRKVLNLGHGGHFRDVAKYGSLH